MKKFICILFCFLGSFGFSQNSFFELRTYTLEFGKSAAPLNNYLSEALIPALNAFGIEHVGVFDEMGDAMPKKIYVLISYPSIEGYAMVLEKLKNNKTYLQNRLAYDDLSVDQPPYARYSTSFFTAIDGLPKLVPSQEGDEVFELRIYEGYNENAVHRKIDMFNSGELDIFKATGLHSIFFGAQVAGPNMPSLTYMISFASMEERDANWKKFIAHPEWKRMSSMKKYANSVSNIHRIFLKPLSYSQL